MTINQVINQEFRMITLNISQDNKLLKDMNHKFQLHHLLNYNKNKLVIIWISKMKDKNKINMIKIIFRNRDKCKQLQVNSKVNRNIKSKMIQTLFLILD